MTKDEDYDALSQKHLASLKRDTRVSFEDATVRAAHKVMNEFNPDWDEKAVLVEEMQRMAKELQASFKLGYDSGVLETQLDQALERNFCSRCGKRLMSALGPVSIHTCCPPFPVPKSFRESVSQQMGIPMTPRTFDDYGNKIV